jgi:uncharacterized protein (TIGR03437 family)
MAGLPAVTFAFSTGPPIRRTGAAIDGGLNCTACHRTFPVNSPGGSIRIEAATYNPGVTQTIRVIVAHPEATRWGFQLTARQVSDERKPAGSFVASNTVRVRCDDGAMLGQDPPCNENQPQFAMHNANSTTLGAAGQMIFEVQWNPPTSEIGAVVFYAAGNAANNSMNNQGDRIYTTSQTITGTGACTLSTRPTLRTVTNGASFAPGISAGSMFSVLGMAFQVGGTTRTAARGDYVNGQFPKELGCVAVEVAGQRVPITYVQTDQINAQAPANLGSGPVQVRVILNPDRPSQLPSDVATVQATSHSPAFFKFGTSNSIAAQHANFDTLASPSVVPGARPARPGDVVLLYGTGFGGTDPTYQAGEIVGGTARLRDTPTVVIGGITLAPADVQYAGLTPQSISGLYQFNVRIPPSVTPGDVPVSVRIGGMETPAATIPVAP